LPGNYFCKNYYQNAPLQKIFKESLLKEMKILPFKEANRLEKGLRWSYKAFAILHALQEVDANLVIWMDADIKLFNSIPTNFFENLIKNKLLLAYPQKIKNETHIESGLVIFNKLHKDINTLINHYKLGYINQEILKLNKPWDGFWLGKYTDNINYQSECILQKPPLQDFKRYLIHNVGKDKFLNTKVNKYSGRDPNSYVSNGQKKR